MPIHLLSADVADYERSPIVLAMMLYPAANEAEQRGKCLIHYAAEVLRQMYAARPDKKLEPQRIRPVYLLAPVPRSTSHYESRLLRCLEAGHIAMAPLMRDLPGAADIGEPREFYDFAASEARHAENYKSFDIEDFRKRHFYPVLPVLHLAAAACAVLQAGTASGIDWIDMLIVPDLLREWLREAEILEPLVIQCWPRLQPEAQMRFRMGNYPVDVPRSLV